MNFDLNAIFASVKEALDAHITSIVDATFESHHSAYDHAMLDLSVMRDTVAETVDETMKPIDVRIAAIEQAVHIDDKAVSVAIQAHEERLRALEDTDPAPALLARIERIEALLGFIFMVPVAKMDYTPESIPELADDFDRAIIGALEIHADDAIEALATGDCSPLMDDGVESAVKRVIENGDFSIEFNTSRRRY